LQGKGGFFEGRDSDVRWKRLLGYILSKEIRKIGGNCCCRALTAGAVRHVIHLGCVDNIVYII